MKRTEYRVFVDTDPSSGEKFLAVHKVLFDNKEKPIGFEEKDCTITGESEYCLRDKLELISQAVNKPWLDKDNFPEEFDRIKFKFNGGRGAVLCSSCDVIIREDLTDEEFEDISLEGKIIPPEYCDKCKKNN